MLRRVEGTDVLMSKIGWYRSKLEPGDSTTRWQSRRSFEEKR